MPSSIIKNAFLSEWMGRYTPLISAVICSLIFAASLTLSQNPLGVQSLISFICLMGCLLLLWSGKRFGFISLMLGVGPIASAMLMVLSGDLKAVTILPILIIFPVLLLSGYTRLILLGGVLVFLVGLLLSGIEIQDANQVAKTVIISLVNLIVLFGLSMVADEALARKSSILDEVSDEKRMIELAAESSNLATYRYELASDQVKFSQHASKVFQTPVNEWMSLSSFMPQFFDDKTIQEVRNYIEELVVTEKPSTYQITGKDANGQKIVLKISAVAEFKDGQPHRLIGTFSDVTELEDQIASQKQLALDSQEKALQLEHFKATNLLYDQLEQQRDELSHTLVLFERTQSIAEIGSFKTDLATSEVWSTDTLKRIFGYEPEESFGQEAWESHIHPDDVSYVTSFTNRIFNEQDYVRQKLTYRIIAKSGDVKHVEVNWDFTTDAQGNQIAIEGTVQDVTDEELARINAEAARAELADQARKRNDLFGMVAHELRTPVAAISMMATEKDPKEWQSSKNDILRSSRDLLNTIDDMSLLINPELKRPIRPEAFSVNDLNATVASSVASIVASTGVQYQQYNAIALPLVDDEFTADTYRVRVVITNLVKNACLHSRGTNVWMFSRMAMTSQGGEYLEWVVGDNGTGIPEDQIDGLFKAGVRGDSEAEGTGFGLYIAKNWIEEINGSIDFRPRKKGGSEFIVRLPLVPADGKTATTVDQAPEIHTQLEDVLPKLNVLLAEDEAMLRMLAQKLLSRMVGTIKAAQHGRDGLEQFDSTVNLVLTDYFMPEMSGVELTKQLRQQGYTGVILGITAATIGEKRQDLLDAGVDMVLPKPLNAEMFRNTISQLISEGRFDDLLDEGAADA